MPVLKVIRGDCQAKMFELEFDMTVIGRHPKCEVTLEHPAVSRRNTLIEREDDCYFITDLGSHNRTIVNGEPISDRVELCDGDEIQICGYVLQFILQPSHLNDGSIRELVG